MAAARPLPSAQYLQLWRRVFDRDASAPPDSVRTEAELRTAVVESDTLNRRLFATGRDEDGFIAPEILEDPYLGLLDVHANFEDFRCVEQGEPERSVPKVFPLNSSRKPAGERVVVDRQSFQRNYELFTENLLRDLDWSSVFAAGGSALACLQRLPPECDTNRKKRKYMHDKGFPGSDIDLFLYGLSAEEAKAKILEIYDTVCDNCPFDVICFRSSHSISMVSQYPYRHVQVVLRLYSSPSEVLNGFDVDSCAVGYDGQTVWVAQRAHLALTTQQNPVDMTRRSPTYEMRLAKYALRGFEVAVPGLDRSRVDPMLLEKPWKHVQGLGKLLLIEKLRTPEARFRYKEQQRSRQMQRLYTSSFARRFQFRSMMHSTYNAARMETVRAGADASDYSTVFLPWGPGYTASRCARLMRAKDTLLNNCFLNKGRKYRLHPCFIGTAKEVIEDCAPKDPPIPEDVSKEELAAFVRGPISFLEDDPGRQMIGSFHPVDGDEWAKGAFFTAEAEQLCYSAAADDTAGVKAALEGGVDVNTTDYCGRTPLHIAALGGCLSAAEALLEAGADPFAPMADGRSSVHIAAAYGNSAILAELLKHGGEDIKEKLAYRDWNFKMTPLHFSLIYGQVRCTELLLEAGADCKGAWTIEEENCYGAATKTPVPALLIAASVFDWDEEAGNQLVRLLVAGGASSTRLDMRLQSLLHLGVMDGNHKFVKALLEASPEARACLSVLSLGGRSPVFLAAKLNSEPCMRVLLAAGALPEITQEMLDEARQRGAALLQKSCNYELQRHATLELKAVQQPLAAAVEAILSNQQDAARIVKLLRPLERAEEQALLGGQNSPLEAEDGDVGADPLCCIRLLLAAGAPVNAPLCSDSNSGMHRPRHSHSAESPSTLMDLLESTVSDLESKQPNQSFLSDLTAAIENLNVDPESGFVQSLSCPGLQALKRLPAPADGRSEAAHRWQKACLQAAAAGEQASILFNAVEALASGTGADDGQGGQSDGDNSAAALEVARRLRYVIREAGGKRWHVLAGEPAPDTDEKRGDEGAQKHNGAPPAVQSLLEMLSGRADAQSGASHQRSGSARFSQLGPVGGHIPDNLNETYSNLFAACWAGDQEAVESITAENDGTPIWVAVMEVESGLTPYMAASLAGHTALAAELLAIAERQYSPPADNAGAAAGGGEDFTKVNNYSLVSAMEPRDDSDCSEEGEGEECEGDYTERQLVAEVISSASAARDEAAYVLDAAKGVSVEEGTGKKALIRCPAEIILFQQCKIPISLYPELVPSSFEMPVGVLSELIKALKTAEGNPIRALREQFPQVFPAPAYSWQGSSGTVALPAFVAADPLRLAILRKDEQAVDQILSAAAALTRQAAEGEKNSRSRSERVRSGAAKTGRKTLTTLLWSESALPLHLAVLLDSPAIVARLLKTAAGGLNFGPALDMMWSASEHKPPKVVPDPKVCSVAKLALQCRAKAVLEWCLGTGPEEVMLQFLTEGGEVTAEAAQLAALLPHVGRSFPTGSGSSKRTLPTDDPAVAAARLAPLLSRLDQRDIYGFNAIDALVARGHADFLLDTVCEAAERLGAGSQLKAALDGSDSGNTIRPIHAAALRCDARMVEALLKAGADEWGPDVVPGRGWNMITFVLSTKKKEEDLLTALRGVMDAIASTRGDSTVTAMLLQQQGKQKITPLMAAQTYNSQAVVDALLERLGGPDLAAGLMGCSAFGRLPLNLAVRGVRPSAAKALVEAHRAHALDPSKPLAVNKEDLMGCTAVDVAQTAMAMAASKALGALSTETDIQRARGSRQTTGPPLEAECLAIVREAQTNTRRDVAQFEDVIALRSLGAAEATIAAEKQGSHGSFFLPGNRNLAAEEEADFAHSIDPPTSRDPVGGERGFSSLVIKTTGS